MIFSSHEIFRSKFAIIYKFLHPRDSKYSCKQERDFKRFKARDLSSFSRSKRTTHCHFWMFLSKRNLTVFPPVLIGRKHLLDFIQILPVSRLTSTKSI